MGTVLVVDADTSLPGRKKDRANMVKLPGALDENGKGMSPERTIKMFLVELVKSKTQEVRDLMLGLSVVNPSSDLISAHFLSGGPEGNDRVSMKQWWTNHWNDLQSWGVISAWAKANPNQVTKLQQDTESAVDHVAKH